MAATRQVPFFLAQVPGGGQDTTQRFALQVTGVARMWYVFALNKATIPMPFTLPGGSTQVMETGDTRVQFTNDATQGAAPTPATGTDSSTAPVGSGTA